MLELSKAEVGQLEDGKGLEIAQGRAAKTAIRCLLSAVVSSIDSTALLFM